MSSLTGTLCEDVAFSSFFVGEIKKLCYFQLTKHILIRLAHLCHCVKPSPVVATSSVRAGCEDINEMPQKATRLSHILPDI